MDYAVILSPTSLANLKEITSGLAADDPLVAGRIGNKLLDRIAILQAFPMAGSVYVAEKKWRKLISRPYVIVYRVNKKRRLVEILTFRHSARMPYSSYTSGKGYKKAAP